MPETAHMYEYRKGDVVLVSFPAIQEEAIQVKRRPAVVVSNNEGNARLDDVLLVPLTTNAAKAADQPTRVAVGMNTPEGRAAGLRFDSVIDCSTIATIPKSLLVSKIGAFPPEIIKRIDDAIRRGLDLDGGLATGVPRKPLPSDDESGIALPLPEENADDDSGVR